jgi:hypothetical protein
MRLCVRLTASVFAAAAIGVAVAPAAGAATPGAGAPSVSAIPDRPCLRIIHRDRCHPKKDDKKPDEHGDKGGKPDDKKPDDKGGKPDDKPSGKPDDKGGMGGGMGDWH